MKRKSWSKRLGAILMAIGIGALTVCSPLESTAATGENSTNYYTGVPVGEEWDDTNGESIQAHGGGFLQEDDTYYWVGENKSHGSANFKSVSLYSSKDLLNWKNEGEILTADSPKAEGAEYGLKDCKIERPKLVKNPDGTYVLWAHWEDATGYSSSQIMVATSDSVTGPYTFQGHWRPGAQEGAKYRNWRIVTSGNQTKYISDQAYVEGKSADLTQDEVTDTTKFGYGSRDLTVYAEGDTAYLISAEDHEKMRIHELNTTFDDVDLDGISYNLFEGGKREAPALVKVDNVYYIITSSQSGWYPNQAKYAYTTDIANPDGWSELKLIGNNSTFFSQPTNIMTIQGKNGNSYVYMGDRWNSKALGSSNYVWLPLTIDNTTHTMDMTYCPGWKLDVATGSIVMPETKLVSQNKKVYADPGKTVTPGKNDTYTAFELKPEYANDGNYDMDSFWNTATNRYYGRSEVPYTWTVDLEKVYSLSRVDISYATCNGSESYYGYNLKGSNDNENWTVIKDGTDNKQVAFTSDAVSGKYRYLQVEVTKVINDHNGNSTAGWANGLIEVQVYADNTTMALTDIPQIKTASGTYYEAQQIEIVAEAGADIYYTTDGTEPTTDSNKYDEPITISKDTVLKAIAVAAGKEASGTATANYHIINPTDVVKLQDSQTLNFAVFAENGADSLPKTLKVVTADGNNKDDAAVTWNTAGIDLSQVYTEKTVTGTLAGGYEVTATVAVVPKNLVMFIDCGTKPAEQAKTSSEFFEGVKNLLGSSLLNNASDQKYNDTDQWGYTGTVGDPNKSNANYGIRDGANYKANGWWGKGDREMPYQVHLSAGTYQITSGHQEWWNATRNMTLKVTANGQSQTASVHVDRSHLEATGQVRIELAEESDVTISVYGNGAVLSWIAVEKENTEPVIDSIKIAQEPTRTEYTVGETLDLEGLKLMAVYDNGEEKEITEGYEVSGYDMQTAGTQTVKVSYEGKEAEFTITVKEKEPVDPEEPVVESIRIVEEPTKTEYTVGETLELDGLKLVALYEDGEEKEITGGYEVSGYDMQTAGTQTVKISYEGKEAEFTITVKEKEPVDPEEPVVESIRIVEEPTKTEYTVGETLELDGLKLVALYEDGEEKEITEGYEVSGYDMQTAGTQTVKVSYGGKEAEFTITVKEKEPEKPVLESIKIAEEPAKTEYTVGEALELSGLKLIAVYNNGEEKEITEGYEVSGYDMQTAGTQTVKVSYEGKEAEFTINVKEKEPEKPEAPATPAEPVTPAQEPVKPAENPAAKGENSVTEPVLAAIRVAENPTKVRYNVGEALNLSGLKLIAVYDNAEEKEITKGYEISGYDMQTAGTQIVKVNYGGMETGFLISVNVVRTEKPKKSEDVQETRSTEIKQQETEESETSEQPSEENQTESTAEEPQDTEIDSSQDESETAEAMTSANVDRENSFTGLIVGLLIAAGCAGFILVYLKIKNKDN